MVGTAQERLLPYGVNFKQHRSQPQLCDLAARLLELCYHFPPSEDRRRRECRAPDAPAAARVVQKARALVTTFTPATPGIPRAMVLTAYFVLPGDRALLPPSLSRILPPRKLSASVGAPGPHDFAAASSAFVSRAISVHRIPPHVRDDRETPLRRRDDSIYSCFYLASKYNSENRKSGNPADCAVP
jgi:hypothetical protein